MVAQSLFDLPSSQRDLFIRAQTSLARKQEDYAITLLLPLVQNYPCFLEARRLLRQASLQKFSQQTKSTQTFLRGKAFVQSWTLFKKKSWDQLAACEVILTLHPYSRLAHIRFIRAAHYLSYFEVALMSHETLHEQNPRDLSNLHALGDLYLQLNLPEQAEKIFTELLQYTPADPEARNKAKNASAAVASQQGGWESAQNYRELIEAPASTSLHESQPLPEPTAIPSIDSIHQKLLSDPHNASLIQQMAEFSAQKGDQEITEKWYQRFCQQIGQPNPALKKQLDDLLFKALSQQIGLLYQPLSPQESLTQQPDLSLRKKQQLKRDLAQQRVAHDPHDFQLHLDLGEALTEIGEYQAALRPLQTSRKQASLRAKAHYLLGICYWHRHMLDLAEKNLKAAQEEISIFNHQKKQILYHLGQLLLSQNRHEEGIHYLKEIYEVDIDFCEVARLVESSYASIPSQEGT